MYPFDSFAYCMNIHPSIRLWGPIVSPHPAWRRPILVLAPPGKTRGKQSVQTCPSRAQEWSVSVPLLRFVANRPSQLRLSRGVQYMCRTLPLGASARE